MDTSLTLNAMKAEQDRRINETVSHERARLKMIYEEAGLAY
jgi:hypothetical protein